MKTQRFQDVKDSLKYMSMAELQEISDDLSNLISVLTTRQVAIEDTISERLEESIGLFFEHDDAS